MVPRRASVPRVNATRVTYRKPTSHTRKSGLLSSGPQTFRAVANVAHLKSPKSFLEELRSDFRHCRKKGIGTWLAVPQGLRVFHNVIGRAERGYCTTI